ncbi:MAG: AAA family ATPase [Candidatus Diapherotrites archaeon]|nr:AAA family ATPase [Candidatus Diapherotrites archaeon]
MQCIVLVGLARSGKDTLADYLCEKYNFKKFVFSDVLVELAEQKKLEPSKMNLVKLGDELRAKEGMHAVASRLLKKVKGEKIILVGARSKEEFFEVKKKFSNTVLISISAPQKERFERKNDSDPLTEKEFFSRDKIDAEKKGLNELISLAEINLINSGSLEELHKKADELIKKSN